ncbi:hypothetical protein LTR72_011092 [Exophiala xenobiotica]|nr:hypothetical protein LTR72_011092 [Exophiala xenobiotica]KAK5285101.1 hypothetical protein LTR14_011246 [Exophiala xenobiotica]KAK5312148.1 hypothetical protein LTR93_011436 [Exophiala xenobiotica]KAK5470001.1 hypothetical protein LTR55_011234 [Exophiala xenobiotica]
MGDTIEVVHGSLAKSQVYTKRDEAQSPSSPVHDEETEIIAAPQSRQDSVDPESFDSDTSTLGDDPRLPPLPPLPSKFEPLTADGIQKNLAAIEQAEEQLIKETNNLKARHVEEDVRRRQHNECEDREWDVAQQKRKERNERIYAYRQNQDAAITKFEIEMEFRENVLRQCLKRVERGHSVDEVVSQLHDRSDYLTSSRRTLDSAAEPKPPLFPQHH